MNKVSALLLALGLEGCVHAAPEELPQQEYCQSPQRITALDDAPSHALLSLRFNSDPVPSGYRCSYDLDVYFDEDKPPHLMQISADNHFEIYRLVFDGRVLPRYAECDCEDRQRWFTAGDYFSLALREYGEGFLIIHSVRHCVDE